MVLDIISPDQVGALSTGGQRENLLPAFFVAPIER